MFLIGRCQGSRPDRRSPITEMTDATPEIVSVNVGRTREVDWNGQSVSTAIWKFPVSGRHLVAGVNVAGDDQADRTVHGGDDKAVYAYALEDYQWWEACLDRPLDPGTFGENLTVRGVDLNAAIIGERWRIGTVLLQVTQPRVPCFKLGIRMGDHHFPRRFAKAGRPGAYLSIIEPGELGSGDTVQIVHRPDHALTIGTVERSYHADRGLAPRLVTVDDLPRTWRIWAAKIVASPAGLE